MLKYPALKKDDIPANYVLKDIYYRRCDFEKYHVIFWHRLLRTIYQVPLEIECEIHETIETKGINENVIFRKSENENNWEISGVDETFLSKMESGEIKPFPINWKYLVLLPSGGILELGTRDKNTAFYVAQVVLAPKCQATHTDEAEKFIDLFLREANRLKDQLFSPTKEFERGAGLRLYWIFNVYLSNYLSGQTMIDVAASGEPQLRDEFMRYDARTSDLYDREKKKHIDNHMLTCGTFYCSAISYLFMSLEGFVNLVFHSFLKKNFRDKDFKTDQRLDLEQKLRFMPSLCNGFDDTKGLSSAILTEYKKLKNYRNTLFHSKIEDSLRILCFVEDGFLYNYDIDAQKTTSLPSRKIQLTLEDVIEAKKIVDDIINAVLKSMDQDTRVLTEKYILKESLVPFSISETGDVALAIKELA
jgi:hypothetical protein